MKYKILALFFCVFIILYFILLALNPEEAQFYIGSGRYYTTSVANIVTISFVAGVLISVILGFLSDAGRAISSWRAGRQFRRREEFKEALEKARSYEMKGEREKAIEHVNKLIRSAPDLE